MGVLNTKRDESVCVVAHPDDEVLWFASILRRVDRVVLAFGDSPRHPELGASRAGAVARLPYDTVWLRLPEAGTYDRAYWRHPEVADHGLALGDAQGDPKVARAYERNFHRLREELVRQIPPGSTVFTHNPWGEYGHADHVQVCRVVSGLREKLSLELKVSPYVSTQSRPLAQRYAASAGGAPECRRIDSGFANRIAGIYKSHGCWTWAADWEWYESECMLDAPSPRETVDSRPCVADLPILLRVPSAVDDRASAASPGT